MITITGVVRCVGLIVATMTPGTSLMQQSAGSARPDLEKCIHGVVQRILPNAEDANINGWRKEIQICLRIEGQQSFTRFVAVVPWRPTTLWPLSNTSLLVAGTDGTAATIRRYDFDVDLAHDVIKLKEEIVRTFPSYAAITNMRLASVRGKQGILCFDRFDGVLFWLSMDGTEVVELVDAARCPELVKMWCISNAGKDEQGRMRFILCDDDDDHITGQETFVIAIDTEDDGVVDSVRAEG